MTYHSVDEEVNNYITERDEDCRYTAKHTHKQCTIGVKLQSVIKFRQVG